jgi:hypothetical protein
MTLAELERAFDSRKRVLKAQAQERASYDYILADLIGRSIARVYSSANSMPDITSAYPSLFDNEEIKEKKVEKRNELSILRFKQFADSYNKKFNGGANKIE